MKLSEILKICSENETADFRYSVVCGSTESQVTGITSDSRKMQDGYAFVCIKGAVSDGHKYIDQIKDKASVIVVLDGEYEAKDCKAAVVMIRNYPGVEYVITANGGAVYSVREGKRVYQCLLEKATSSVLVWLVCHVQFVNV